jgi:hypothetical protein
MTRHHLALASFILTAACAGSKGRTSCGIAALAGPSLLVEEFTKPGRTLAAVPEKMPEVIPVRMAAGPGYRGIVGQVVGKTEANWVIGVDSPLPEKPKIGYGVLVDDPTSGPAGVLLFEGVPVPGAPVLGTINAGAVNVPLIGVRASVAMFEEPGCLLFPDSLRRR